VPRIDAVWKSWPQACITPLFREANGRFVFSSEEEGITVLDVPKLQTGVIAEIKGDKSGPVIAVRAGSFQLMLSLI
jgi:hypothetical protein